MDDGDRAERVREMAERLIDLANNYHIAQGVPRVLVADALVLAAAGYNASVAQENLVGLEAADGFAANCRDRFVDLMQYELIEPAGPPQ